MPYRLLAVFNQGATNSSGLELTCRLRSPSSHAEGPVASIERTPGCAPSWHVTKCAPFLSAWLASSDTARPPTGLEHLYGSHMHTHHTAAEVEALEVRSIQGSSTLVSESQESIADMSDPSVVLLTHGPVAGAAHLTTEWCCHAVTEESHCSAQSRCRASLERFPSQVLMGGGNGWALEARTSGHAKASIRYVHSADLLANPLQIELRRSCLFRRLARTATTPRPAACTRCWPARCPSGRASTWSPPTTMARVCLHPPAHILLCR